MVLFVSLWVYFGGELIYPLNYRVFKTIKYKIDLSSLPSFIISVKFGLPYMNSILVGIRALVQWLDIINVETMVRCLRGIIKILKWMT